MVSFDLDRASKTTAIVAILALALPVTTHSQEATPPIVASIRDSIEAVETQEGPNSVALIDPLTALGLLYRERSEPFLAAGALSRAVEIVRLNYGLHSLEQAPLLRQMILNAESIGDHQTAWDLEQGLLRLGARNPDDPRTAQILRDTANRRMDVLAKYEAGEFPPEVVIGCYYRGSHVVQDVTDAVHEKGCNAGTSHRVREGLVTEAQAYYAHAVDIILRNQRYSSDDLPSLLMELVQSSYRYGNAALGRRSLSYLLAYETSNASALATRIDTLVQIADWDLLHAVGRDAEEAALAEYAQAYSLLEKRGIAKQSIDELFSPATPTVLPAFLPNPFENEEARDVTGHLDVAFDVDRYGRSRKVRVLESSGNTTRLVEKRLVQLISRARFRPRFVGGRAADPAHVVVRYDFNASDGYESGWPLYWEPAELYSHRVASMTGGLQ